MEGNDIPSEALRDVPQTSAMRDIHSHEWSTRVRIFLCYVVGLSLLFLPGALEWGRMALTSKLHSHILLVPFISIYLLFMNRGSLATNVSSSRLAAVMAALWGSLLLLLYYFWGKSSLSQGDAVGLGVASYLCFLGAGLYACFGGKWMKSAAFPLCFLWFMVPLPDCAAEAMENVLVKGSAVMSELFFRIAGIPVYRSEESLQLPGIVLEVARECSGIRSTWVLVITSLVAAYLFLRSPGARALLVALILPLGVLRNALRILVLGWLCVSRGPQMIDSRIHHEGGPLFFAVSLVPLFLLAWFLRSRERLKSLEKKGSDFLAGNH